MKIFNIFKERRRKKVEEALMLKDLKATNKIKFDSLVSDYTLFKLGRFKGILEWIAENWFKQSRCYVWVICEDKNDIIRKYKMVKPYTLEINGGYYLFNASLFRNINGNNYLVGYRNIIGMVSFEIQQNTLVANVDTQTFKKVQQADVVRQAIDIETEASLNIRDIIMIIVAVIIIAMLGAIIYLVNQLKVPVV